MQFFRKLSHVLFRISASDTFRTWPIWSGPGVKADIPQLGVIRVLARAETKVPLMRELSMPFQMLYLHFLDPIGPLSRLRFP
jgi:hypothetical protein